MTQSRIQSLIETITSVAVGFAISMGLGAVVYPAFGHPVTFAQNFWITAIFTVASIARGFVLRRIFNRLHSSKK